MRKTPIIVVYAGPAWRNRQANPYNYLLSEALSAEGCEVHDLNRKNGIFGRPDVVHIHWPQNECKGPPLRAIRRSTELVLQLALQRVRGAATIWTAHNVYGHDQDHPLLERIVMWCVTRMISGVVYLSTSSQALAEARYPKLRRKPHAVIPHGLYGASFSSDKDRAAARAHFGIPLQENVISFIGDIAPYKGLDELLKAAADLKPSELFLLVAGSFKADENYSRQILAQISQLQSAGHRIAFIEQRLTNSEMVDAIKASDIVALPYKRIANSGLAMLALEHAARLLVTDHPVFRELRDEIGSARIMITGEHFSASAVRAALADYGVSPQQGMETFRRARSWPRIAASTVQFYRRCGARFIQPTRSDGSKAEESICDAAD